MEFTAGVHRKGKSEAARQQRYRYVKKSEQVRYVKLWQESGMTMTAFCEQYDLKIKTFDRWRKNQSVTLETQKVGVQMKEMRIQI